MQTIAYRITLKADGWHAEPNGAVPDAQERVFPSRDAAVRWCRSIGFIPEGDQPHDEDEIDVDADIDTERRRRR